MNIPQLIATIDEEIARLEKVRSLLSDNGKASANGRGKSTSFEFGASSAQPKKRRGMSPEGRARIAAAQKKRWAAQKKKA